MAEHGYINDDNWSMNRRDPEMRDRDRDDRNERYRSERYPREYSSNRADRTYGSPYGSDSRFTSERDRSDYRRHRDHDDGRSFWDQMKDEARSWFGADDDRDDHRRHDDGRDRERSWSQRHSYGSADRFGSNDRWNDSDRFSRDRDSGERGYGQDYGSRGFGSRDLQGSSRQRPYGQQGRQDDNDGYLIVEEYTITTPTANTDDHYRNLRNRQMQSLDRDYQDYCREREQQFHQDFDSWRQSRSEDRSEDRESQGSGSTMSSGQSSTGSSTRSGSGSSTTGKKENSVVSTAKQSKETAQS